MKIIIIFPEGYPKFEMPSVPELIRMLHERTAYKSFNKKSYLCDQVLAWWLVLGLLSQARPGSSPAEAYSK